MGSITYVQAFREGMLEEMARDETIFVVGNDLFERGGHFAQVKGLGELYGPSRIRDAPISEAAMVAAGVGAALSGMRPVVDLNFIDFSLGAMDEIVNQAAKMRYMFGRPVPMVVVGTAGVALYAAQHNNSLESWFVHTPGLLVLAPATPYDCKGLLKSALRADDPIIFLLHKLLLAERGEVGGPEDLIPIGRAVVRRNGRDATVAAFSIMVSKSLQAASLLESEGIDTEVIDLRTLCPLDLELIAESVRRTGRLVVATEEPLPCSVASEIAASITEACFHYLDSPVVRVCSKDAPIPHSPKLIEALVPQPSDVVRAVRGVIKYDPSALA